MMLVEQRDGKTVVSRDPAYRRRAQLAAKSNRTQAETLELILLRQDRIEGLLLELLQKEGRNGA
ncbi:MAG: hypothetical protein ACOY94_19525 [Bacillota bacterium]